MTAEPRPAELSPFLAFVGTDDRNLARAALWLGLGSLASLVGLVMLGAGLALFAPDMVRLTNAVQPLSGPRRLLSEAELMALAAMASAVAATGFMASAVSAYRRPAWTFVAPARPFSFALAGTGFLVYGGLIGVSVALALTTGEKVSPPIFDPAWPALDRWLYALAAGPFLLLAAAAEELVFRGALLQITSAFVRNRYVVCVMNGILFSALHLDPSPAAFLARLAMGAVFAWSVLELGGVEFSLGAHFANNFLIVVFVQPFSAGVVAGPEAWGDLAQTLGVCIFTLLAVTAVKRRRDRGTS